MAAGCRSESSRARERLPPICWGRRYANALQSVAPVAPHPGPCSRAKLSLSRHDLSAGRLAFSRCPLTPTPVCHSPPLTVGLDSRFRSASATRRRKSGAGMVRWCLMLSWSGNGAGCELQLELQFTVNSYPFSVPRAVSPTPRCTVQRCTLYSEARYRSPRSTPMLGTCGKRRMAAWSSPRRLSFASYEQCAQSDGELLGGRMRRSRQYAQRII